MNFRTGHLAGVRPAAAGFFGGKFIEIRQNQFLGVRRYRGKTFHPVKALRIQLRQNFLCGETVTLSKVFYIHIFFCHSKPLDFPKIIRDKAELIPPPV